MKLTRRASGLLVPATTGLLVPAAALAAGSAIKRLATPGDHELAQESDNRSRRVERRPDETGEGGGSLAWVCLTDGSVGFESDGTHQLVPFYEAWKSDNADDYFTFEWNVGAGQFGDDTIEVGLKANTSGIYTYTLDFLTSDLPGSPEPLEWRTVLMPGASGSGSAHPYPGIIGFPPSGGNLINLTQLWIEETGGDDLWIPMSWTLPVKNIAASVKADIWAGFSYSNSSGSEFWSYRLWITRHGDDEYADDNFTDSFWFTGEPIP